MSTPLPTAVPLTAPAPVDAHAPHITAALGHAVTVVGQSAAPFYLQKKVWLGAVGLVCAVLQAKYGANAETAAQLQTQIVTTCTWLLPILGMMASIAHVDGKNVPAAFSLVETALAMGKSLNTPDAPPAPVGGS
jgi:hypothetical protein